MGSNGVINEMATIAVIPPIASPFGVHIRKVTGALAIQSHSVDSPIILSKAARSGDMLANHHSRGPRSIDGRSFRRNGAVKGRTKMKCIYFEYNRQTVSTTLSTNNK